MRTILSLLLCSLLSAVAFAQFPTRSADVDLNKRITAPLHATSKSGGAIFISRPQVTSATAQNLSTTIEPGKVYALDGIQVFCDRPYWVNVTVKKTGGGNFNNTYEIPSFPLGDKEVRVDLPYSEMLYEGGSVAVAFVPLSGTATQDQAFVAFRMFGRARSLFEVDNPDFRILVLGDSKPLSTLETGSYGERFYVNQLAKNLQGQGKRVSVIDKTMPGCSSADIVRLIKSGGIDNIPYDLMVYAGGTNNAGTTATAGVITQFKADITEAILHRNRLRPTASILYMTPGVTDKSSLTGNIDAYRTAVSDVANDATLGGTSRKVYLCQEHLAFTISTTVKSDRFKSDELLNNQLHYSMLGHDDVYNNRFLPAVKLTDFYLNVLKLNYSYLMLLVLPALFCSRRKKDMAT